MKLVIAASAAIFLLINTATPANAGKNVAQGNSGSVKTHNLSEFSSTRQNSKIAGTFTVHGSKYAAASTGTWTIYAKPWKSNLVLTGSWTADSSGQFTTSALSLPKGHYKLFVSPTGANTKHKVFKVTEVLSAIPTPVIAAGAVLTKLPETGPLGLGHVLSMISLSLGLAFKTLGKMFLRV